MSAIGVMGGTFDPIHYGHLVAAEGVHFDFELERVCFVPAGRPPHKALLGISAPEHRHAMTTLAVSSNPHFTVLDIELRRPGPSYTYDTIRELHSAWAPGEVVFITGADAVLEILTWHRVKELLEFCRVVAVKRPGYDLTQLKARLKRLPAQLIDRIVPFDVPGLAISSSDIRKRVREGRPIKYLLPENVEDYIMTRGLYR